MILPHTPRTDAKIGTDPVAVDFAGSPAGATATKQTLIVVCTVLGAMLVLGAAFAIFLIVNRRRRRRQAAADEYKIACLRTPGLTWEEYARRTKLSQSRIMLEEELQRSVMIRKSLQSRPDVNVVDVEVNVTPVSPPARTRSRAWHSRRASGGGGSRRTSGASADEEEGEALLMSVRGDWTEHEARVERTWQLLHKKYPTRRVTLPVEEDGDPVRPPTIRLKTPPLLSHPMFRGWNAEASVKHSSLPTELTKIKPAQI